MKTLFNLNIDWKSKFIDLLIVIIGISIAFQLNTWNEINKTEFEAQVYIESFHEENLANAEKLRTALDFSKANKNNLDTLKQLLLAKNYDDERIQVLTASMMALANYNPNTTTMKNVMASGEFDLIIDVDLRKSIIDTYNSYDNVLSLESLLSNYVNTYVTPYFFENVRFSDFSSIESDFVQDPMFENIVFGYIVLLDQEVTAYQNSLEKIESLNSQFAKN